MCGAEQGLWQHMNTKNGPSVAAVVPINNSVTAADGSCSSRGDNKVLKDGLK